MTSPRGWGPIPPADPSGAPDAARAWGPLPGATAGPTAATDLHHTPGLAPRGAMQMVPLASLVSEDLRAVPGPTLQAALARLAVEPRDPAAGRDAVVAALLAGEPRRALALLRSAGSADAVPTTPRWGSPARSPLSPRVVAALTAWVQQLEANWYPGNVGGVFRRLDEFSVVVPTPGTPEEELLERVVAQGPPALLAARVLVEGAVRSGDPVLGQVLGSALGQLDDLASWASSRGEQSLAWWAALAGADLLRRARDPGWFDRLQVARSSAVDPVQTSLTFLVEGDAYGTPGSSAEAMGWDLAPQPTPPPAFDLLGSARCWGAARALLGARQDVPRLSAAIALRHALLARAAGRDGERLAELDTALSCARAAGDGALERLVLVHRVIADVDAGRLTQHAVDLGGGWRPPTTGPIADVVAWGGSVGSRSWCVGLSLLLERFAGSCYAGGSPARGRVAATAAAVVRAVDPDFSPRQVLGAMAQADSASNLAVNAQLRLERAFGSMLSAPPASGAAARVSAAAGSAAGDRTPAPAGASSASGAAAAPGADPPTVPVLDDAFVAAVEERSSAATVLVDALNRRLRGPSAAQVADRLTLLRDQVSAVVEAIDAVVPPDDAPLPATPEELQRRWAELTAGGVGAADPAAMRLFTARMVRRSAREATRLAEALTPLACAEVALGSGRPDVAEQYLDAAAAAAAHPDAPAYLLPVVLVRSRRLDRAREVIAERATAGSLPLPVVATLAAAAGDHQRAAAALQAMDAAGASGTPGTGVPLTWQDALPRAEVELALGRVAQAWDTARAGVAQLEAFVAELVRDPDRLDACDQPDVAALYGVLARAALAVGGPQAPSLALMSVERLRLLSAGVGVEGDGDGRAPGGGSDGAPDADPTLHRWRRAAADYSVAAGRVLARVAGAGVADDAFADLDAADAALAGAERDLDARRPGILLRRAAPRQPEDPDAIRARMPPDAVLLEYLTTSDEVLGWAVTREGVRTATVPCPRRELAELTRRLHASCAAGHADPAALAQVSELVLGPWRAELDTHERVVVVPFGSLAVVPFHVLRTGGVPLAATHVVSYALRATDAFGPDGEAPVRARRPLVVGDPAFDPAARPGLRRLPGAEAEARAVAAALGLGPGALLLGDAATEAAVTARLDASDLLHVASHGRLDELSPFASALVLAGADELTVSEIAGERFGTDLAVLTGCDTARGTATLGGDLVGLSRALLRSGVRRAIVSMWPVDDAVAPVLVHALYRRLADGEPPARALALAGREVASLDADALRAAAQGLGVDAAERRGVRRGGGVGVVAGGGAGAGVGAGAGAGLETGTRTGVGAGTPLLRGLLDDPSLRDEDEPEALGGDAERYWAPFVLVG